MCLNMQKVLSSTWTMKKKSNGTYGARMNMSKYEQIDGEHYDSASISSPVTNDVSMRVLLILLVMADNGACIVDVQRAFLIWDVDNDEMLYFKIPEEF